MDRLTARPAGYLCVAIVAAAALTQGGCAEILSKGVEAERKRIEGRLVEVRAEMDTLHVAYAAGEITRAQFDARFKPLAIEEMELISQKEALGPGGISWIKVALAGLGIIATGGAGAAVFGGPRVLMLLARFVPLARRAVTSVTTIMKATEETTAAEASAQFVKNKVRKANDPLLNAVAKKLFNSKE